MKKSVIIMFFAALLFSSCASEFNRIYKYGDAEAKYEYAKEAFARGKFQQASTLLQEFVTMKKGSDEAQECLYMLAMSEYCNLDYESASETFKKYTTSYPRGYYVEPAYFYVGQSLYESSPELVSISRPRTVLSLHISSSWIFSPIHICGPRLRSVCMN